MDMLIHNPPSLLSHLDACDELEGVCLSMAILAAQADPELRVPSCPRWNVADLLTHVGHVHRWITRIVQYRHTTRPPNDDLIHDLPRERGQRASWFMAGIQPLLEALRSTDPDTAVWTWAGDGRARFWSRRMLHETLIHATDLQLSCGLVPSVAADLAVDGIGELLSTLASGRSAARDGGSGVTIQLTATDRSITWTLRLLPGGAFQWPGEAGPIDSHLRGPVSALLLVLYRRMPLLDSPCVVEGSALLAERWLSGLAL